MSDARVEAAARRDVIREALRFANWAAGEGLYPAEGQPCRAPDEFLSEYTDVTGDDDWEALPVRLAAADAVAPEGMSRSPQYVQGFRAASKGAVAWLHARARSMSDARAAALLNGVADSLGRHFKDAAAPPPSERERS
jgi:hypothetical protein